MDNQNSEDKSVVVGKYTIKVVRNLCISAASCVAVSPGVFELDGESKATVKPGALDEEANILLAAQTCPTKAIVIIETATGKQVWPV